MLKRRRPQRRSPTTAADAGLPMEINPMLREAILAEVDKQLATGEPPAVRATQERLVGLGYSRAGARELIAHVVVREVFAVMARGERYDAVRYTAALARLPDLAEA